MSLLDRIERRTRWFAVPHLALPLVMLQSLVWVIARTHPEIEQRIALQRSLVLDGEWWRTFTFLFKPTRENPLWLFVELYLFWVMSNALQRNWGAWRYNLYLLIGWLATVGCIFIAPEGEVTNEFILGSVLLAFAELFPDYQLMIYFLFPVKVRYIALVTWIIFVIQFGDGGALLRITIAAGVINYFFFFTRDLVRRLREGRRRLSTGIEREAAKVAAMNTCIVCGATEKTHPRFEFRYCPKCAGTPCYCMTHMDSHVHRSM